MIKLPRPRLADVARAADVSLGTASNVFAHPERVRAEVRERVEAVARALGYAGADPMGRLLREGTVNAIGVVAPGNWGVADALRNPVYRQFMTGAAETCDARGANLVVVSDPERGGVRTALVDGFILSRVEHIRDIEPVRRRRLPFVLIDFDAGPEIGSVRVDARAGAREAARHLVALGHRRSRSCPSCGTSRRRCFTRPEARGPQKRRGCRSTRRSLPATVRRWPKPA